MRIPISVIRRFTVYDVTPYSPSAAMSSCQSAEQSGEDRHDPLLPDRRVHVIRQQTERVGQAGIDAGHRRAYAPRELHRRSRRRANADADLGRAAWPDLRALAPSADRRWAGSPRAANRTPHRPRRRRSSAALRPVAIADTGWLRRAAIVPAGGRERMPRSRSRLATLRPCRAR